MYVCILIHTRSLYLSHTRAQTMEQAAAEVDMDGLLPIHWALRNENKLGSQEAVSLLLKAYPDRYTSLLLL